MPAWSYMQRLEMISTRKRAQDNNTMDHERDSPLVENMPFDPDG
jgi:hypothetical protein